MSERGLALSPAIPHSAVEAALGLSLEAARARHARLTRREAEVARWIATDRTHGEIVADLGISPETLDIDRARVKENLQARTTVGVANAVNLLRLADGAEPASDIGQAAEAEGG
jgi:FixJ family two-component response regulator